MDTNSILNNCEPTFFSTNGSSITDLCPIYGPIVSHYEFRGHLPVLDDFAVFTENLKTKEMWLEKANWKLWTDFVETGIIDRNGNNSTTLWKTFLNLLLVASEQYIPLKPI